MTPQIANAITVETEEYSQPSKTFRISQNNISGKIDGLESVKQAIQKIVLTERFSNPIYDDNYGIELEQYIGKEIEVIEVGIEETLKSALLQDDRITNVKVNSVKKSDKQQNSCVINFTVISKYGNIEEAINVIQ